MVILEVVDMIMEEIKRKEEGLSTLASILNVESRVRNTKTINVVDLSPGMKDQNPKAIGTTKVKIMLNVGTIKKMRHFKSKCRVSKKENDWQANGNVMSNDSDDVLICSMESETKSWVLNSGASFHVTSNKEVFENNVSGNMGNMYLDNDQACDVIGQGAIHIKLNRYVWKLKNVRHAPSLRKNLISIKQLAKDGYVTTFSEDTWKISKGTVTVA